MNYYRLLLLILMSGATQLISAQNKVLLKMSMAPDKTYKTLMNNQMEMEMNVKGDSALINQLTSNGMTLPITMHMTQSIAVTTKTGAQREDKIIPVTITYDKMSATQSIGGQETVQDTNPFANTVIEGTTKGDWKISIDTIRGELNDAMKTSLRQVIDNLQGNINFPTKELKIGDSFDQELPMNLPIPEAQMRMKLVVKYILKEIKNNKALFDLKETINMDMDTDQGASKGTGAGTGTGTLIFDIGKSIAEHSDSDIEFHFEFSTSGLTMIATCKTRTSSKCNVE